jgi:hypothetical protein
MNIFRFVGLGRALEQIAERGKEKVCREAVKVRVSKILMQGFHQMKQARKREVMK